MEWIVGFISEGQWRALAGQLTLPAELLSPVELPLDCLNQPDRLM